MKRKILLIEPNYKNKYPPIGLMKLATYYRTIGDDVRFYKGDMKLLAVELICEDLINHLEIIFPEIFWKHYYPSLFEFIKTGKYCNLENYEIFEDELVLDVVKEYRTKYRNKEYFSKPRFDRVGITTLFTFYFDVTVDTINFAKQLCKDPKNVMVGGILATLLPEEIEQATGIKPFIGLLDTAGVLDSDNDLIIDNLPLDYSILEETEYIYPTSNSYFSYMTRGCVNKCKFCAVPKLEPKYCDYINLKENIEYNDKRFGKRKDLLLLDNNVLASKRYNEIIEEIKDCGFGAGATYTPTNEYEIAINNLKDSYNDRAYIKKVVSIYKEILEKLNNVQDKEKLYSKLEEKHCLYSYTACKENILALDEYVRPLYKKIHKFRKKRRIVDFNQGIDSRLITEDNIKKLSEINIEPLRIAFDHWSLRNVYEKSVRISVNNGIKNLSNYILYNFNDKPEELYHRLRLNVDLCEELNANIYSFPMKYHPLYDKDFYMNRDYIGKHWNRKFIRAVQSMLNATKGKVGRGVDFFEVSFGKDIDEFMKILYMPETFIIYRSIFDANFRDRAGDKQVGYTNLHCDLTNEWWLKFKALTPTQLEQAKSIIEKNDFKENCSDKDINEILKYYRITRDDVENNKIMKITA